MAREQTGFIKIHRKILDSEVWKYRKPIHPFQAWIDLLLYVNWEDNNVVHDSVIYELKRGEMLYSLRFLGKRWGWSKNKVGQFLRNLEHTKSIKLVYEKGHRISKLIIYNYNKYNPTKDTIKDSKKDTQGTLKGHAGVKNGTNKNEDKEFKETNKRLFVEDSIEFQLSKLLYDKILKNNPNHKKPNLQEWAKHIDLMIRKDNRKPKDIGEIIDWCQSDNFWCTNILSANKLRKQFDQLTMKMTQDSKEDDIVV